MIPNWPLGLELTKYFYLEEYLTLIQLPSPVTTDCHLTPGGGGETLIKHGVSFTCTVLFLQINSDIQIETQSVVLFY